MVNNSDMNKAMREKYENASKTPEEAVFSIKDVKEILNIPYHSTIQRFDMEGLIKVKRNSQNFRIYSYNNIQILIKFVKLLKLNVPLKTIKTLMEFEKSKGRDENIFLEEFTEFYTKRLYSANRNAKRKQKKDI